MTTGAARATRPTAILAIILISYFMILLDNSVVFTGLPGIRADLELSTTTLSWVQDAYTLVFGDLLLLGARAGDLVGRRRLFLIGLDELDAIDAIDTGVRGGPEPEQITRETFGREIPEA